MRAATETRREGPGWNRAGLPSLLLLLATLAVYAQVWNHEFVSYDDGSYITENPHVRTGLSAANAHWAFFEFHSANWHPLTWLSHQLDCSLFGLDPGPHHLENALLHGLNALLCFLAFRSLTGERGPSFFVALFFALHPVRVESVAWASERKDVLSGLFFFSTLWLYARYARAPSIGRYLAVAASFALGLLAKPMLVTLPFVLLLLDVWPLGRPSTPSLAPTPPGTGRTTGPRLAGHRLLLEKVPLVALAAFSCWITLVAQRQGGAIRSVEALSIADRVATVVQGYALYLGKAFWPARLAFFYPHPALVSPESHHAASLATLGAALLLITCSVLALLFRRRAPWLAVGWFWFLGTLVPVIGLVQVGGQRIADRYAYLALVGIGVALVFGLRSAFSSPRARPVLLSAGWGAGGCLGVLAFLQTRTWKDSETLYEHALKVTEKNYVAHNNLGLLCQRAGDLSGALEHYLATLAVAPRLADAHSNLGAVYMELGQREPALEHYRKALDLRPGFVDPLLNWGLLLEREEDHAGARDRFEQAVAADPTSVDALMKLGESLMNLGDLEQARVTFERALALRSDHAGARAALGLTRLEQGERDPAAVELQRALELDPENPGALVGLAWIMATSSAPERRDPAGALEYLQRASATFGSSWRHRRALAAALAARGDFEGARRTVLDAEAAAPQSKWAELRAERASYEAGKALFVGP